MSMSYPDTGAKAEAKSAISPKETNPKDAIGAMKSPLELVPDTLVIEASMAFLEGALKYGRFNWRAAPVRASIYRAAMQRHMTRWWNGEDRDPETGVKHLASVAACVAILLDADLCGTLKDDRPPGLAVGTLMMSQSGLIEHLKTIFADCTPHQWTIGDVVEPTLLNGGKPL